MVRELSLRGPLTAGAIARGLPDVPMNQLVQRLAELDAAGLVTAGEDGAYRLTEAGAALEPVLDALARFGLDRLAGTGPRPGDPVVAHVLMRQLELRYEAAALEGAGVGGRFELVLTDPEALWSIDPGAPAPDRFALVARGGLLSARAGAGLDADAVLRMSVAACCDLVAGVRPAGVEVEGDAELGQELLGLLAPAASLAAVA
jgi:hypothetical protein